MRKTNYTARLDRFTDSRASFRMPELPLNGDVGAQVMLGPVNGPCALESDEFPFEDFSNVAETESWRKEINRPTTHIHKWWAQRLGTVFRAMAIGAFAPSGTNILDLFYRPVRIQNVTVFDPFMGSGTTLVEAVKLGAHAIGRDINPVAHFLVKCALSVHDRKAILETFRAIEYDVAENIRRYYRTTLSDGTQAEVLYYFWVKTVNCPSCSSHVDLFSSRIFARHAYPKKYLRAHALCPYCDEINEVHVDSRKSKCDSCKKYFDPSVGLAKGKDATCPACKNTFPIAKTIRATGHPPVHRLYAKLVLLPDGTKKYLRATVEDCSLYAEAERLLGKQTNPYPIVAIEEGYNTNQALGYNYRHWHEMFNARQLLCLSLLADRIRKIPDSVLRELFTCLFSGSLEFNNMFASYKGEGTGAVRHMFAHHILKPERVPLEANLWGTEKSSGSFSTMFEGRIRRALEYAENPFELQLPSVKGAKSQKVYGLSRKIGEAIFETHKAFEGAAGVYLSCGDSRSTDIPNCSVDAVLTDPPFFDNVHYSQLADFFHVWQRHILGQGVTRELDTTRSELEVQSSSAEDFTLRLAAVWQEVYRVLKDNGLLAFTYHHSRPEGWRSVLKALMHSGFCITAAHPIKAEMSVAMPKQQAKEPIDLDIIMVCRKRKEIGGQFHSDINLESITELAQDQINRFRVRGRKLSRNDVRVIVMAQFLRHLTFMPSTEGALHLLDGAAHDIESTIEVLHTPITERSNTSNLN